VFDTKNVKVPYQSDENLEAYVKLKSTGETIPHNSLSTGIRNFIFRFGHIYSLYFNRKIERGFLLIDEPELSLFPDLLYDIIERYKSIIHNTQFFVATHSPVIAAQFQAKERIILEFDDHTTVQWRRGISPEGDDPNDLLVNDFAVRSLYGKKGIEQWEKFLRLRREIAAATDPQTKLTLLDEYAKIGNAYNFAPDEIPA
jgi:predicted ATPase